MKYILLLIFFISCSNNNYNEKAEKIYEIIPKYETYCGSILNPIWYKYKYKMYIGWYDHNTGLKHSYNFTFNEGKELCRNKKYRNIGNLILKIYDDRMENE